MSPTQKFDAKQNPDKSNKQGISNEIIIESIEQKLDPIYDGVLNEFKESYEHFMIKQLLKLKEITLNDNKISGKKLDEVEESLASEKMKNEKLEEENIRLSKEYEKQCVLIKSQNGIIKELKEKLNHQASEQSNNINIELKNLYKENYRLENMVKSLSEEVNKYRMTLDKISKDESMFMTGITTKENAALTVHNTTFPKMDTIGISKSKKSVVIPKLDFTKLPQKKQAIFKVIQYDQTSISSSMIV